MSNLMRTPIVYINGLFWPIDKATISVLFSSNWHPSAGQYGLLAMIIGSLSVATISTLLALIYALSISLAIESMSEGFLRRWLIGLIHLLTSIPTVVYGFLGLVVVVPLARDILGGSGMSMLVASCVLSGVIAPTMILFFHDTFSNIPSHYKSVVYALGGNSIDFQFGILLKYARNSIGIGIAMGFARAIGDTMIALMIAGSSISIPTSPLDSIRTLTAHIALLFAGDFESMEFKAIFISGLMLFCISFFVLLVLRYLRRDNAI